MDASTRRYITYRQGTRATEFGLESTGVSPGHGGLVGVVAADDAHEHQDGTDEAAEQDGAEAGLEVGVGFGGEDAEDVVVLVHGLAEVAALLLVPPVAVGVAEGALDGRGVLISAVLLQGFGSIDAEGDAYLRDREATHHADILDDDLADKVLPVGVVLRGVSH